MPENPLIRQIPRDIVEKALKDPGLVRVFLDVLYGVGTTLPENTTLAQETADYALIASVVPPPRPVPSFSQDFFQPYNIRYALSLKEDKANKDASGGYVGLTGFSINFKNALGTFTSLLANANTAARTYTFPNRSMTVAGLDDITGGAVNASFANITTTGTSAATGGFIAAGNAGMTGVVDTSATPNLNIVGGLVVSAA